MNPRPLLAAALAALLLPLAAPALADHATSETKPYTVGGQLPLPFGCSLQSNIASGVSFCGLDAPAPATVEVRIDDATRLLTGGFYRFADAQGTTLGQGLFCAFATLPVPPGATELKVVPSLAGYFEGCYGPGTTGTVTATWSGS